MKKGLKIFVNILKTIAVIPCGIVSAVLLVPFMIIGLIIAVPMCFVEAIWKIGAFKEDEEEV